MKRLCAVGSIVLLISGCGSSLPPSQEEFGKSIEGLRERYEQAQESGNQAKEKAAEAAVVSFLRGTPRRAERWMATVESIDGSDTLTVVANSDSQIFRLQIVDAAVKSYASGLSRGEKVFFSGPLGSERSLTIAGALDEPEFSFYPEELGRVGEAVGVKQSAQLIQARLAAERQEGLDTEARGAVAVACERAIEKRLMLPESADFSWLKMSLNKIDGKTWLYVNVVEAKNAFGNVIPHRFACKATVAFDGGEAIADVMGISLIR